MKNNRNDEPKTYHIDTTFAVSYVTAWQRTYPNLPRAFKVDRDELLTVLGQHEGHVDAIRFYLGIDEKNALRFILVGVKNDVDGVNDRDLISHTDGAFDFTQPCPGSCPTGSLLNMLPPK